MGDYHIPLTTIPRSPWIPSAGLHEEGRCPVLANVAAILLATNPDLPSRSIRLFRAINRIFTAEVNAWLIEE